MLDCSIDLIDIILKIFDEWIYFEILSIQEFALRSVNLGKNINAFVGAPAGIFIA